MAESIDVVNHPSHYADGWSNGAEVIDITENLNFNRGNAVKYIARAGAKDPRKELEDLQKAQWYLSRELTRLAGYNATEDPEDINPVLLDEPLEYVEALLEPRVWKSINDIPENTTVTDIEGDALHVLQGGRAWWGEGPPRIVTDGWLIADDDESDDYAPFTEVLEDRA